MCESFAQHRLRTCPADIDQRLADGLGDILSLYSDPCGKYSFDFESVLNMQDPTDGLPVLFSSENFTSADVVATTAIQNAPVPQPIIEYWYGPRPGNDSSDTWCCRSRATSITDPNFYFLSDGQWVITQVFKSQPGVCVYGSSLHANDIMLKRAGTDPLVIGGIPDATACQVSGNGQQYFVRGKTGWLRYRSLKEWTPIGQTGADLELSTSHDGNRWILSRPDSAVVYHRVGTQAVRSDTIPAGTSGATSKVYAAAGGRMFFVVRGREIYSVGSQLPKAQLIYSLPTGSVASGMWGDRQTVWVATDRGTYMSSDVGCTWVLQANSVAVGLGLYTKASDALIYTNSADTFAQSIRFPLRLNNGGRLSGTKKAWSTWFEDRMVTEGSTEVKEGVSATLSLNGLYLVTQRNGVVTLHINVWNFRSFAMWCRRSNKDCKPSYLKYCEEYQAIDKGCKDEEPGTFPDPGSSPGSGSPGSPGSPGDPKPPSGLSTGTIVGIVLGSLAGIGLLVVLILHLKKTNGKSKARPKA